MATGRRGLSASERVELWRRWRDGQSLSDIGRALGKAPGSVHGFIAARGGISPAPRTRSPRSLTLSEREEISRGLALGESLRSIARSLGRSPSTVSREVARNGGSSRYRAAASDANAWERARRPKDCKLAVSPNLRREVASKLQQDWSPEQIAGWLRCNYGDVPTMRVSHETIYRSLYIQARGVLDRTLLRRLRTRRLFRRSKKLDTSSQRRGHLVDAISIHERGADVELRDVVGHWEGDLVSGSRNSHIATLVDRRSRFTLLVHVAGKDSKAVVAAVGREIKKLPVHVRRSLTWDRGPELARHRNLTEEARVPVFFCDAGSPWQRGTNENTNGLVRQYLPSGTDLSGYTQASLNKIAARLNSRPRKSLAFRTPDDIFAEALR